MKTSLLNVEKILLAIRNFKLSKTALIIEGEPKFEDWLAFGAFLKKCESGVQWWVGDWWNFGCKKWQRREPLLKQALLELGFDEHCVREYARVCRAIKMSVRTDILSFDHHTRVAALPPAEQAEWLKKAADNHWSVSELRRQMKLAQPTPELPEGKFDIIYADPPWQYDNSGLHGAAFEHYPTLSIEEICALPIPIADNAVLFLWATNPFLNEVFKVVESWEFDYKTNFVWVKEGRPTYGKLGFYVYGKHELLLLAVRGNMLPCGNLPESVIEAKKTKHSRKPKEVYDMIEQMYPQGHYLELFARNKHNERWTVWGLEAPK